MGLNVAPILDTIAADAMFQTKPNAVHFGPYCPFSLVRRGRSTRVLGIRSGCGHLSEPYWGLAATGRLLGARAATAPAAPERLRGRG